MRKRLLALAMTGVLLGITACSGQTDEPASKRPTPVVTEAPTEAPQATATPEATTAPTVAPTEAPTPTAAPTPTEAPNPVTEGIKTLPLLLSGEFNSEYDDVYGLLAYVSYEKLELSAEGKQLYPELSETLSQFSSMMQSGHEGMLQGMVETAKEMQQYDDEYIQSLYRDTVLGIARADEAVLSVVESYEEYTGGVHGYYAKYGHNFDTKTGETLELGDVVTDLDALKEELIQKINAQYEDLLLVDAIEYISAAMTENDMMVSWAIGNEGLIFYFNPYDIASYADGLLTVMIPFAGKEALFAPKYTTTAQEYAVDLSTIATSGFDFEGNGTREQITLTQIGSEDGCTGFTVTCGEDLLNVEEDYFSMNVYQVHLKNGREVLLVAAESYDLFQRVLIISKINGKLGVLATYDFNGFYCEESLETDYGYATRLFTDPSNLVFSKIIYMIGNRTAQVACCFDETGKLVYNQDEYLLDSRMEDSVIKDFTATAVASGEKKVIPAGSKVVFVRSDGETYMIFTFEGEEYRIEVNTEDWPRTIDGVDENEIFADIIYAG